jgi:quercetin dioxygenase-like cupin family protein
MKAGKRLTAATAASVLVSAAVVVLAQNVPLKLMQVVPGDLKFRPMPNGTLQAAVVGDSTKPGLYAIRTKLPAGLHLQPHFHPDERIVTVLAGTLYVGFGEKFDTSTMRPLPPGGVFTEPARQPHFTWAKDGEVLLQISGNGPTGTTEILTGR